MKSMFYVPVFKISDAEMRGLANLDESVKESIHPIIELTRSRASKTFPRGSIFRRLEQLKEAFGDTRIFFLDTTTDPFYTNEEIEILQDNKDGYSEWIKFLDDVRESFPGICPIIQISYKDVDNESAFYSRIKQQIKQLDSNYSIIGYRFPLFNYDNYIKDLSEICGTIKSQKIVTIIDAEFIGRGMADPYAIKTIDVIGQLQQFSLGCLVLCATSFPSVATEYSNDDEAGNIHLVECEWFDKVRSKIDRKLKLVYGDYGTINPTRSQQAGGRGWIPRIDMPTEKEIFYYRSRKSKVEMSYSAAYIRAAKLVVGDQRFSKISNMLGNYWNIEQINMAAEGYPQGLSPSYWISVRMNGHISLRTKLLKPKDR